MRIPTYRKKPGEDRNYAFVEWRGARIRLPGKYDSVESREAYKEFLRTRVFGTPEQQAAPVRISLAKMFDMYLEFAHEYYTPRRRGWEYLNLSKTLKLVGIDLGHGAMAAEDFAPSVLKRVQRELVALGHTRKYVNTEVSRIRRAFRWAVSEGIVPPSMAEGLRCVEPLRYGRSTAPERIPVASVPEEIFLETLPYLPSLIADMFSILWYTGVRSDSLCQARPEQFDFSDTPWIWTPRHKTEYLGIAVQIPIGPQCQRILARHMVEEGYIFRPEQIAIRKRSTYTDRFDSNRLLKILVRAIEDANAAGHEIPPWHTHQIRHAHAERVDRMFGREAARTALAHASVNTTAIYAARDLELAIKVANAMG
ncbi:MAG: tyrosine-type recombinase/integrase [Pirellulaceae bacterium]